MSNSKLKKCSRTVLLVKDFGIFLLELCNIRICIAQWLSWLPAAGSWSCTSPMIFSFFISGAYDSSDECLALGVTCSAGFQSQTDTLAPGHCRTSQSYSALLCLALRNCWIKGRRDEPDHDWNLSNNSHAAESNFFTFSDPCLSQPWPSASRRDKKPPGPTRTHSLWVGAPLGCSVMSFQLRKATALPFPDTL